jgi:hypothetical protein
MEPRHHRAHRHLEGRGDVSVRHLLDVEEDDGHSRPLVQIVESSLDTGKLLPQRGLILGTWRRGVGDRQRLHPGYHLPSPEQVQTEPPCDGDEPGQDRALRIEPLEVDEGAHERVLGEILRVGRSEQSPAEAVDGPAKAQHQLVEGRRIAAAGATRKLEFCSPVFRIRTWGCCMAGLYDRTLLVLCQESTGDARGLFQAPDRTRVEIISGLHPDRANRPPVSGMLGQTHHRRQLTGGSGRIDDCSGVSVRAVERGIAVVTGGPYNSGILLQLM